MSLEICPCPYKSLAEHNSGISAVAFHPGKYILAFAGQGGVWLWDVEHEQEAAIQLVEGETIQIAFHPSGRFLATAEYTKLRIWDLLERKELWSRTFRAKRSPRFLDIWNVAFSPDGSLLASVVKNSLYLWEAMSGRALWQRKLTTDELYSVAFSPDGRTLVVGDYGLRLWYQESGWSPGTLVGRRAKLRKIHYTSAGVWSLAFSPDGQLLASSTSLSDYTTNPAGCIVRLWNVASGENVRQLAGFLQSVDSLAFSPDGQLVAAAGEDTVRLWNVHNGEEIWRFQEQDESRRPQSVAFSFDGHLLAVAMGRELQLWQLEQCKGSY